MTVVKHIVFSGGGPIGMVEYGAIKYLTEKKFIEYKNIESIYAISIGGIVGLIYILNYDWEWMDDFLIKRPWNKLVNFSYSSYINILYEKGLINKTVLVNAFEPLFLAKNIPLNITLLEFYNLTKIEFNIFACCLDELQQKKFNYITTPDVELLDALYISLTIPIMFVPLYINNSFYLDGGIIVGCPINQCIAEKQCDHDEILCFMNNKSDPIDLSNSFYSKYSDLDSKKISNESNFFEYIFFLIKKFVVKVANVENDIVTHIKNSINGALSYNGLDKEYWAHVINCQTEREHLINLGVIQAEKFLDKLEKLNNNNNELINNSNIIENTLETSTSTNNSNDETILETSTNNSNDETILETSTNNNITINQETALENSNTIIQNSVTITS
jgi:predicted acylesterase/phospholipase RssA